MRIRNKQTTHGNKNLVALAVAAVMAVGSVGFPLAAGATSNHSDAHAASSMHRNSEDVAKQHYQAGIQPLNNGDVRGDAKFVVNGNQLTVHIYATGLEEGVHPQHIHGHEEMRAECPTDEADTNNDGFLSVVEGAPAYGPIKMNLTSPQTPFGEPPTLALFAPFAGTADNANFPVVGPDGILDFEQTYTFDSNEAAQAAKASLMPLGDQHIVIHGGTAPKSVDADAFEALGAPFPADTNLSERFYDPLLPVGCGDIESAATHTPASNDGNHHDDGKNDNHHNDGHHDNNGNGTDDGQVTVVNHGVAKVATLSALQTQLVQDLHHDGADEYNNRIAALSATFSQTVDQAVADYNTSMSNGANEDEARNQLVNTLSSAKDAQLNGMTEARNQKIDALNRAGDVAKRDMFLHHFDATVNEYKEVLETAKNSL